MDKQLIGNRIQAQAPEEKSARGRLKIFLGYAPGVGKTFAMLDAARTRRGEGINVVVGIVETHAHPDTEAFLEDLPRIACRQVPYYGSLWNELDVDAIRASQPQLVLVDDLAHRNIPGSRHSKRYQDVEELLEAGIDVYATLNIYHVESLNDVTEQITGLKIRETLPDRIVEMAAEIELVDLPPRELIRRLEEDRVYIPPEDMNAGAARKFFRLGNLTALREMALRRVAFQVGDQMRAYMHQHAIPGPWGAEERILVGISPSPLSEKLVRTARRLASEIDSEWMVIYVEMPGSSPLSHRDRERVHAILRLAEELGAQTTMVTGEDVAETLVEWAKRNNITKILVGKPLRTPLMDILRRSPVDRIIRSSGDIDVYVVSSQKEEPVALRPALTLERPRQWRPYLISLLLVALAAAPGLVIRSLIEPANLVMLFLLIVVVVALQLGRGPAILAAVSSVLVFDYFMIPPYLTLAVSDVEYLLTFAGLLVVGLVISELAARARHQAQAARRREFQTNALFDLSRELAAEAEQDAILSSIINHVERMFECQALILTPDQHGAFKSYLHTSGLHTSEAETQAAEWVYRQGKSAGRGTGTFAEIQGRYLPMKTVNGVVGVLGIQMKSGWDELTPENELLLTAFANQGAVAIERVQFALRAQQTSLLEAREKLQTALMNSISHDLRTPLVAITGALSTLAEPGRMVPENLRRELIENAYEEADRLNRLVGNLLDMTRLEAGAVHLKREPCDLQDVVGAALRQLGRRLEAHQIVTDLPPGLPDFNVDFVLITQVLVNLIDNAIKYAPAGSAITISATAEQNTMVITVIDQGPGVPEEAIGSIFDKLYRVKRANDIGGTGLGLSICQGIVDAHGGQITARNRLEGGLEILVQLPLTANPLF